MDWILDYQWGILVALEVVSLLCLLSFGVVRYVFGNQKLSIIFLWLFIGLIGVEALLALFIYRETGEMAAFQLVVIVFVLYACTFGIYDFKKLDRWMRWKVGNWRGVELLTAQDRAIMAKQRDPQYIAKVNRKSAMVHLLVFFVVQAGFWIYGLWSISDIPNYLTDWSWLDAEHVAATPYANETMLQISRIWAIVFVVDFIYSWSYTIFPAKHKSEVV